jgi:Rps23 Pro-64 3,4-dihydroxylase Tpa1-like proline 4-hydroxylase
MTQRTRETLGNKLRRAPDMQGIEMERYELAELICQKVIENADRLRQEFASPYGTRTRHFCVDDLLLADVAAAVAAAFPQSAEGFFRRRSFRESKHTNANLRDLPAILTEVTFALQAPEVVKAIASITGIEDVEPDETLYAAGLSMMARNDFLNPHIDNSHNGSRTRYRRLNLLYYVTPDWELEFGGNLELWDDDVTIPTTIHSRFNRLVVMETARETWHSVSPVRVDKVRCCVSNYYFSASSPDGHEYFHATEFSARPEQKIRRIYAKVDAKVRTTIGSTLGLGRGRDLTYPNEDTA